MKIAAMSVEISIKSKKLFRLCVCGRGFLVCHCQAQDIIILIYVSNDISRGTLSNYRAEKPTSKYIATVYCCRLCGLCSICGIFGLFSQCRGLLVTSSRK